MHAVISQGAPAGVDQAVPPTFTQPELNIPGNHRHTRLLIAGGDRAHRDLMAANFEADGFTVLTAPTANSTVNLLSHSRVAVLIVDAALVHGPGTALLTEIRSGAGSRRTPGSAGHLDQDMPIIVTAQQRDDLACIRALDAGCDDHITAPFTYMELRARIRALLRRQVRGSRRARLRVGALELDAVSRQAWVEGESLQLSSKEFSLLYTLAAEPTRLYTRAELLALIWGWTPEAAPHSTSRTLDSHACRLRGKLRRAGVGYVINVWGQGYKLIDASSLRESADAAAVAEVIELPRAA
jgi:DNA-binding response OmpR family regulator